MAAHPRPCPLRCVIRYVRLVCESFPGLVVCMLGGMLWEGGWRDGGKNVKSPSMVLGGVDTVDAYGRDRLQRSALLERGKHIEHRGCPS